MSILGIFKRKSATEEDKLRRNTILAINMGMQAAIANSAPLVRVTNYCIRETGNTLIRKIRRGRKEGREYTYEELISIYDDPGVLKAYNKINITMPILEEIVRGAIEKAK